MIKRIFKYFLMILLFFITFQLQAQDIKFYKDSTIASFYNDKIYFVFDNNGNIGGVGLSPELSQVRYNDIQVIYSAGFFLSGYSKNELWTNGVAAVVLIDDYLPGNVSSLENNQKNKIYSITTSDKPFSKNWQEWKTAVEQGAYFYDGNNNGIYDPIDHNSNGLWELNEDRPDLLFDKTFFTVYNDGLPSNRRRLHDVEQQGIEIRQTVFASSQLEFLKNTIFIRYSILNTGLVADTLNDVIFSFFVDPDIGYYLDDLIGCDTTFNSVFAYNDGPDSLFGERTPSVYYSILQGPAVRTSIPSDTAYNRMGELIGVTKKQGFRNSRLASHTSPLIPVSYWFPQETKRNIRALMTGRNRLGDFYNVCKDTTYGMLLDIDCDEVNPLFWFSGNPFKQEGWINSKPVDQRHFANTESFELIKGEPQDIIISITVGHGYNYISELAVTRELVRIVFDEWNSNFASAINFEELVNNPAELTYSFILEQNYPNPFNPVTTIRYSVPGKKYLNQLSSSDIVNTTLIIYDILGREIKTLVNESKIAGTYEITFDASRLASGVYLYRLTSDSFSQTKKMMVIK